MNHIHLYPDMPMTYAEARMLAFKHANFDGDMEEPVMMAWHDRRHTMMSPAIAGADMEHTWRNYGESHCGCLEVDIGDEYEFIFADGAPYANYGPSPYVNLSDSRGNQYICLAGELKNRQIPEVMACSMLDEYVSKLT